ncbi:hypothetical protein WISP_123533 [Willisornis vidua]|uniref:Uncharacterized protein n=1 Tax=Willisornis vidua TaxID=1566151 RepID=A0ABQ9CRV3_9PASS|nr:hypothetical protein WISP_149125 [Willisornis vidua]KAJ7407989.1 hypothetical protein WISP_123533 [Willisornis vidua]
MVHSRGEAKEDFPASLSQLLRAWLRSDLIFAVDNRHVNRSVSTPSWKCYAGQVLDKKVLMWQSDCSMSVQGLLKMAECLILCSPMKVQVTMEEVLAMAETVSIPHLQKASRINSPKWQEKSKEFLMSTQFTCWTISMAFARQELWKVEADEP